MQNVCQEWDEKAVLDANGKRIKRKQTTLKTRKSITGVGRKGEDDDSDDDFKPTKAATQAKKASQKPRAKPAAANDVDDKPPPKKRAPAKKAAAKEESDVDDKPPAAKKRAPAKKPVVENSDVEMIDDDDDPPPSKTKTAKKKVESDDSEEDIVAAAIAKGKGKAKEAIASKRKRLVLYVIRFDSTDSFTVALPREKIVKTPISSLPKRNRRRSQKSLIISRKLPCVRSLLLPRGKHRLVRRYRRARGRLQRRELQRRRSSIVVTTMAT